jgi:anti-sigma factor RsiW
MHPTEGMWQEFLDGESDPPIQRELAIHSDICADCQRTVAALGRRRVFAAELLDSLDGHVPARRLADVLSRPRSRPRTSRRSLLVAAMIALCVVTAAGAVVRTGMVHRAMNWLLGPAPQVESQYPSAPAAIPKRASSTGIAFVPAGTVDIAFEEWPRRGEIEIALREATEVSIIASAPSAYSVREGRVLVANRGVTASYRITLPQHVRLASIRVGDRMVFSKRGDALSTQARKTGPDSYLLSFSNGAASP